MVTDPSHDIGDTGYCYSCTAHVLSPAARYACVPSTAEPEIDAPPGTDRGGITDEMMEF